MRAVLPLFAVLGTALAAQAPPDEVLGLVRTDSGRQVAGAHVAFVPDRTGGLAWAAPVRTEPAAVTGTADDHGRFRFPSGSTGGCLLVETDDGLGAALPAASPGRATPVTVRALAEVGFDDGVRFTAHLRLLRGAAPSATVPARSGTKIRLPAGEWLVLAVRGDGRAVERRVSLRPGTRASWPAPDHAGPSVVPAADAARCRIVRWPEVALADPLPVLSGPALLRAAVDGPAGARAFEAVWVPLDATTVTLPETHPTWRTIRVCGPDGAPPPADTTVATIAATAGGPSLQGFARPDDHGDVPLRVDRPELASALLAIARAPGHAPAAVRVDALDADAVLCLTPAAPLTFRLVGVDGEPVAGAPVHVPSPAGPLLDRVLVSDADGLVVVPEAGPGPLQVEVRDPDHLPLDATVTRKPPATPVLQLSAGRHLGGRVLWPDERPASGVTVELRDSTGALGVETRVTTSARDGSYAFDGLPEGIYVVFASTARGGRTWSGRARAYPGADEWHLILHNEDPTLPGARGR